MLLETLGALMLENILTEDRVMTAGKDVVRVGKKYNNMDHIYKRFYFRSIF